MATANENTAMPGIFMTLTLSRNRRHRRSTGALTSNSAMSGIDGPGGISGPKGPTGPTGPDASDGAEGVDGAQEAGAADAVSDTSDIDALAAEVAAGRLTPKEAIDRLVESTATPDLSATERAELREMLADLVANDPYFAGLGNRV